MKDFDVTETDVPVLKAAYRLGPDLRMQLLGERVTARLLAMDPDPRCRRLWDLYQELTVMICDEPAAGTLSPRAPFLDAGRDFITKGRPLPQAERYGLGCVS